MMNDAQELIIADNDKRRFNPEAIVKHDSAIKDKMDQFLDMMDPNLAVDLPVKHTFINGMYIREIVNPEGSLIVTKIHKTQHAFTVLEGELSVASEHGVTRIKAPYFGITEPGTQRAIYAHSRAIFVTYHPNPDNETDIEKLEDRIIAKPNELVDVTKNRIEVLRLVTGDTTFLEDNACHLSQHQ